MSKKLEQKQEKRLAEERKRQESAKAARKRNFITLAVVLVVGALVVGLIIMERPEDPGTDFGVAADEAGCTDVETQEDAGRGHEEVGTPLTFETQPPTSGTHYTQTADIGFHTDPVEPGSAVHNLEHGQIVVWYRPDAPDEVKDQLETYVDDAGIGMVAIPYEDVPDGYNFTLTAWTRTQSCEDVSGEVLADFRKDFQGKGPEQVGIPLYEG